MKKLVLATAVASLAATAAHAGPKVYGKAAVNLEYNTESEVLSLNDSYGSRLGVKGSEQVSHGLKAFYKAEMGINAFDQGGDDAYDIGGVEVEVPRAFTNRKTYVGLESKELGTVAFGRQGNFVKEVISNYEQFISVGSPSIKGGSRHGNVISYTTPASAGLPVSVSVGAKIDENADKENNVYLAAVSFATDGLSLAAGTQQFDADGVDDLFNVSAGLDMMGINLGLGYQYRTENEDSLFLLTGGYKIEGTAAKLKGQYVYDEKKKDSESAFAVGAEYKFAKKIKAEVYGGMDHNEDTVIGAGMEYKF